MILLALECLPNPKFVSIRSVDTIERGNVSSLMFKNSISNVNKHKRIKLRIKESFSHEMIAFQFKSYARKFKSHK